MFLNLLDMRITLSGISGEKIVEQKMLVLKYFWFITSEIPSSHNPESFLTHSALKMI